jgi:hypothetical protein
MDDIERSAINAEGLNPDDQAVVTAIHLVRWSNPCWVSETALLAENL